MAGVTPAAFGEKLKEIRNEHHYSLRQVSNQSKIDGKPAISASYWSLVERGQRNIPKIDTLKRMAHGLRISDNKILELAGISTEPVKNKRIDLKEQIDDKNTIMTFEGRDIPAEDLEVIKRLLRRD